MKTTLTLLAQDAEERRTAAAYDAYRVIQARAAAPSDPMLDANACAVAAARLTGRRTLSNDRWRFMRQSPRVVDLTDEALARARRRRR